VTITRAADEVGRTAGHSRRQATSDESYCAPMSGVRTMSAREGRREVRTDGPIQRGVKHQSPGLPVERDVVTGKGARLPGSKRTPRSRVAVRRRHARVRWNAQARTTPMPAGAEPSIRYRIQRTDMIDYGADGVSPTPMKSSLEKEGPSSSMCLSVAGTKMIIEADWLPRTRVEDAPHGHE